MASRAICLSSFQRAYRFALGKRFTARTSRAAVSHYLISAAERHFTIKALRNSFEFHASIQPRAIKHAIEGNAFALQRSRYYYYYISERDETSR